MTQLSEAFFIVWNPEGPHNPTYRHGSDENATTEAQRLALTYPGNDFIVMQAVRRIRAPAKFEIEEFAADDGVPF